jgi:hypothetical protein
MGKGQPPSKKALQTKHFRFPGDEHTKTAVCCGARHNRPEQLETHLLRPPVLDCGKLATARLSLREKSRL